MKKYKPVLLEMIPKSKEIKTNNFLSKIYKENGRDVHKLVVTPGMYDHKKGELTDKGIKEVKHIIYNYIAFNQKEGANIASQAVDNLTNQDCNEIRNKLSIIGDKKGWKGF